MKKKWRYVLEYVPIAVLDFAIGILPRSWAVKVGEKIGTVISWFIPKRRALILKNLSEVFPNFSEQKRKRIADAVWRNLGRVAAEVIHMPDASENRLDEMFVLDGEEHLKKAKNLARGAIFIGFHFTNWELSGVGINHFFGDLTAIARPIKNPFVDAWINGKRIKGGMDIIYHRQAVKGCLRVLKSNGGVGILVDQNLYTGGTFVDFLGRPAATTTLPALLHLRTKSPLLFLYCLRVGDKIKVVCEPPAEQLPTEQNEHSIKKITQIISNHLGDVIRQHPENWFWIHNRWKRQPE